MTIDSRNSQSSLVDVQGEIEAWFLFDQLHVDFGILTWLQAILTNFPRPSYKHYTNINMANQDMRYYKYPIGKEWKISLELCNSSNMLEFPIPQFSAWTSSSQLPLIPHGPRHQTHHLPRGIPQQRHPQVLCQYSQHQSSDHRDFLIFVNSVMTCCIITVICYRWLYLPPNWQLSTGMWLIDLKSTRDRLGKTRHIGSH